MHCAPLFLNNSDLSDSAGALSLQKINNQTYCRGGSVTRPKTGRLQTVPYKKIIKIPVRAGLIAIKTISISIKKRSHKGCGYKYVLFLYFSRTAEPPSRQAAKLPSLRVWLSGFCIFLFGRTHRSAPTNTFVIECHRRGGSVTRPKAGRLQTVPSLISFDNFNDYDKIILQYITSFFGG